jgi:phosphate-selective porin
MQHGSISAARRILAASAAILLALATASADEDPSHFSYGKQGWQYDDGTGNNFAWFGVRVQARTGTSRITQDEQPGDSIKQSSDTGINRGRLKLGGHAVSPAFTFYSEYDFVDNRLLDLRASYRFRDWLSIRAGQWKSEFNRERVDSSGKQQFVERSIATPWFTIDRQQGVVASGRFGKGSRADVSHWAGWLSGAGRGGGLERADGLWLTRAQWNIGGRVLDFSQSALGRPEEPEASIAVAVVNGRSGFTSFSSAGGGQIPSYENGDSDRYRIEQWLFETAYQHHAFSWQQEVHYKKVRDRDNGRTSQVTGGYAQAGWFPEAYFEGFPEPLEIAVRYARVHIDDPAVGDDENEYTIGANWFFNGHRNKLTLDLSYLTQTTDGVRESSNRARFQWDWSF